MKYSYFAFIIILYACTSAKNTIVKENYPTPFEFTLIDSVNANKNDLYVKAFEWMAKNYGSAKTVIEMQDKDAGKIIGKAIISLQEEQKVAGTIHYVISIDVRDGKYRCTMTGFRHEGGTGRNKNGIAIFSPTYGDLNKEKVVYKNATYNKMMEDQKFYLVKNKAMSFSNVLFESFKASMRDNSNTF